MLLQPNLARKQQQTLTITPQVIQAIKLLKFNNEELCAYLREREERNPLIEVVLPNADNAAPLASKPEDLPQGKKPPALAAGYSVDHRSRKSGQFGVSSGAGTPAGDLRSIEETHSSSMTLRESLLQQVGLNMTDQTDLAIACEIVEYIDTDGYLRSDVNGLAELLGVPADHVERVLARIQQFEPTGVGARTLAECLRLQLEEKGPLTPANLKLLGNLELIAKYDLAGLAKICDVDQAEIAAMVRDIRQLNPRPGRQLDCDPVMPALPDVLVSSDENGTYRVELNSSLLPKVLVNREYYSEIRRATAGTDNTRFVSDCMRDATWLTRNLDQRANTVLKVATEIVKRQQAFFSDGVEHMRPLCQSEVADAVGLHRSTVCRAISGKHIMTNRGLFEFKYFFSNVINAASGSEELAAESIRAKMRQLLQSETVNSVMSDDALAASLLEDGIQIARRTVAKYRDMIGAPSSSIRKRRLKAARIEADASAA